MIERVMQLIKQSGLSDNAFEKQLHLSQGTVGNWRSGRNKLSMEAIIKLARYFNVSTDYLLGLTDERRPLSATEAAQPQTVVAEKGYTEIAENFIREFKEQMKEKAFQDIAKLYKAIKDVSLKAQVLTVLVAYLNRNGFNTENIVGY